MEKVSESDINSTNVVNRVAGEVVIDEVAVVVEDVVPVQVAEVDGVVVDPHAVVVNVEHVIEIAS